MFGSSRDLPYVYVLFCRPCQLMFVIRLTYMILRSYATGNLPTHRGRRPQTVSPMVSAQTATLLRACVGTIYRIVDVRESQVSKRGLAGTRARVACNRIVGADDDVSGELGWRMKIESTIRLLYHLCNLT